MKRRPFLQTAALALSSLAFPSHSRSLAVAVPPSLPEPTAPAPFSKRVEWYAYRHRSLPCLRVMARLRPSQLHILDHLQEDHPDRSGWTTAVLLARRYINHLALVASAERFARMGPVLFYTHSHRFLDEGVPPGWHVLRQEVYSARQSFLPEGLPPPSLIIRDVPLRVMSEPVRDHYFRMVRRYGSGSLVS